MYREAALAGTLALLLVGALGHVGALRAPVPATPCPEPVAWRDAHGADLYLCADAAFAAALVLCPPEAPVRAGDRLRPRPTIDGCRATVERLPPATRLALGLKLDVNTEPARALEQVSGIGPALARRIVATRPFADLEDLERVRGIGPKGRRRLSRWLRPDQPPPRAPSAPPRAASAPRRP